MEEEKLVKAAIRKKAYFDLGSLNEENLLKAASYIDGLLEQQEYITETDIKVGE